ncbi:MAG: PD40 domain-containing protein [Fimbriimonadaceae bacterium]|nr:PD40 domain-containing protein [Fimbriimonadaceae bacterium]
MMYLFPLVALSVGGGLVSANSAESPLLMKNPTVNASHIVFSFGGDLWSVPRDGGTAVRLTTSPGNEDNPYFSPDGKTIAFTGQYEGNTDVYVMPTSGGVPKRLTYNPEGDSVIGWSRDGKSVVFSSGYRQALGMPAMFTVDLNGSLPKQLPFPEGHQASFSPDGARLAYVPKFQFQAAWKRYRGGQTYPIWIAKMSDSTVTEIPRKNSNDFMPMWVEDKVYFLSDREGKVKLFDYDVNSKRVGRVLDNTGFDFKSASAGPGAIVLEQFGSIKLYDLATKKLTHVPVEINADFQEVRTRYINVGDSITGGSVSPNGVRLAASARGEIFTVPVGKGTTQNITGSSGSHERAPSWSPDGKSIAFLSDSTGDYELVLADPVTGNVIKRLKLGSGASFYYNPTWSPDSKKIAYTDKSQKLWVIDVETGANKAIDEQPYLASDFTTPMNPSWSHDSKWITYTRQLKSRLGAVFVYSMESGKSTQITDGMSDAASPSFDRNGKYLYFYASTDSGQSKGWLDMSSLTSINVNSSVYLVVLRNDEPSPLSAPNDQENVVPQKPEPPADVRIDFDGIGQRTLSLPMPQGNYAALHSGPAGSFFVLQVAPIGSLVGAGAINTVLFKFDLASRRPMPFAQGVTGFEVAAGGQHILLLQGASPSVVSTMAPPQPGQGAVSVAGLQMKLEPREEWRQIFDEALRIQRDFFYAPNYHGVDLAALKAKYTPFLENLVTREDLNYLLVDMMGELCIGHMYIGGGDQPSVSGTLTGALGADYEIVNGKYRFAKVYNGENWNPGLRAPLTEPGVNVKAGEYLLEINGKALSASDNVYAFLQGTAGKHTRLKVGPNPDGTGSREVVVVPTGGEGGLRQIAWIEGNRRKVEEATGGKAGYVYLPNTGVPGFTFFNRYYYAAIGKEGAVIDERYNGGGFVADYIVDMMRRPVASVWTGRQGEDFASPAQAINGPKVMLINEYAGSGGDYLPYLFRFHKVGQLVGKRTWGGLVGIGGTPDLIDGGTQTAPGFAARTPDGKFMIENEGTPPDVEVEMDPALWRQGRDPQLEKAIEILLKEIANNPVKPVAKPSWPDKTKVGGG